MKIHESGRRKGKALEFVILHLSWKRVFGTGEAAAVAVERENWVVVYELDPDSHNVLRFLSFLGLSRTVISAGNHQLNETMSMSMGGKKYI